MYLFTFVCNQQGWSLFPWWVRWEQFKWQCSSSWRDQRWVDECKTRLEDWNLGNFQFCTQALTQAWGRQLCIIGHAKIEHSIWSIALALDAARLCAPNVKRPHFCCIAQALCLDTTEVWIISNLNSNCFQLYLSFQSTFSLNQWWLNYCKYICL